jgi:hypothetical protein
MTAPKAIPSVSVTYARTGASTSANPMGMRVMQERAYARRGEQYLLIKSPPASGKSRALMFIALDKLYNQGVKQAIIVVPERSIGASFNNEPLSYYGFFADWEVLPQWNLCNVPGADDFKVARSKVKAVKEFLASDARVLVCTHATFRFAVDELGTEAFDERLIAVDEFHHVSASEDNKLGTQLAGFIARDKTHIVAMTGSYFRGDAVPVLLPADEAKFETVTYTYYEQLNGYQYLKALDIGYYFYSGPYVDDILKVLDPDQKTIVHIPSVNSRESTMQGKLVEVDNILDALGTWEGEDDATGFQLVRRPNGKVLKIANLVDDDPVKRNKVITALKDPAEKTNRDLVDIIIALGMAKEGFDWIWCEHALTVGYRSSLTEIIQIIGRATRDAPGKERSRFTNLIAAPDASDDAVTDAVNDTLKAIAASLLMEQVLAPRFNFVPRNSGEQDGFHYGNGGYEEGGRNVGFREDTGDVQIEVKGLVPLSSPEATRIAREDINEIITSFVQDRVALERGLFDTEMPAQDLTQVRMGRIVRERYPDLSDTDQEAIRQRAVAALVFTQEGARFAEGLADRGDGDSEPMDRANTALLDGVRKFALDVRDLDLDMIDAINPFNAAYAILAKAMTEDSLKRVQEVINGKNYPMTLDEARTLSKRALEFKRDRGRLPSATSSDPWERTMAAGIAFLARERAKAGASGASANG